MSFWRAVLAAFIGGLLAIVFALAWRASKETGKSIPASIPDIPAEAQRLAVDVRHRAAETAGDVKQRAASAVDDVKSRASTAADDVKQRAAAAAEGVKVRTTEAVNAGWETIRDKEAALKDRIVGHGTAAESGAAEVAEQA